MAHKKYPGDKLFRFTWKIKTSSGSPLIEEGYGRDVADAFGRLGYSGGALAALEGWERIKARRSNPKKQEIEAI